MALNIVSYRIAATLFSILSICYIIFLRTDIVEKTEEQEEFFKNFEKDLALLLKHDFLAKAQAAYFVEKKKHPKDGEFIVSLDFAENYTFHIQNAIQSHHWSNSQATVHPYVVYYSQNGETVHLSYVISEKLTHDTKSVHLFNKKLVAHLKQKFGEEAIKKLVYFSDGSGAQYKNKFNFVNLLNHEKDFGTKPEWNFFATLHGKGACDGIGGAVKRHAYRASLQRIDGNHMNTPLSLFEWAKDFFKNIEFDFYSRGEHDVHDKTLQIRFDQALTVQKTRQYHNFSATNTTTVECKVFSKDVKSVYHVIVKKKK